jgi:hypothetical protein
MATTVEDAPSLLRSVGVEMIVAMALTAVVYVQFWDRTVPVAPDLPTAALSFVAGTVVGVLGAFLESRSDRTDALEDDVRFGIIMVALLTAGLFLYPDGFPLPIELGLLVAVWTSILARLIAIAAGR